MPFTGYSFHFVFNFRFAYTDHAKPEDLTLDVLAAADKYDVPLLFDLTQRELSHRITVENAALLYLAAYLHQKAVDLKKATIRFIHDHYNKVKITPRFASLVQYPGALLEIIDGYHSMVPAFSNQEERSKNKRN